MRLCNPWRRSVLAVVWPPVAVVSLFFSSPAEEVHVLWPPSPPWLYSMSVVFNADRLTESIQWAICENAVRGMMRNSCLKVLIAIYDSVSLHFYLFLKIRSYALLCYCSAEISIFDPTVIGFSAMFSKLKRMLSHLIVRTKWVRSESNLSVVLMQFDACVFERWCILKLMLC